MHRRLVACLLLSVFLGAGTSLPGPDALLHHWFGGPAEVHAAHVEAAGGCGAHTDQCTLGRTATGAGVLAAAASLLKVAPGDRAPIAPQTDPRTPAAPRGALPQSRAPPAPPV